jgi:hypothetical protein
MAWKVPLIRSATKVGKAMAFSVSSVIWATFDAATGVKVPSSVWMKPSARLRAGPPVAMRDGAGVTAPFTTRRARTSGVWSSLRLCDQSSWISAAV